MEGRPGTHSLGAALASFRTTCQTGLTETFAREARRGLCLRQDRDHCLPLGCIHVERRVPGSANGFVPRSF